MRKIRKISDLHPTIGFTEFDFYQDYRQSFPNSEPGKIHALTPFSDLAKSFDLKDIYLGCKSYFSPEGKIALMLLKAYTQASDKDLITQLNANIHWQLFCGVRINPQYPY